MGYNERERGREKNGMRSWGFGMESVCIYVYVIRQEGREMGEKMMI